ncbi:hypothetical protein RKD24_003732 [Streptomyces calvus]
MSVDRVETTGSSERTGQAESAAAESAGAAESVTTAAVRYYSIAPGVRLNVRSGPGTGYTIVRVLPEGGEGPDLLPVAGHHGHGPVRHVEHLGQHRQRRVRLRRVRAHRQRRVHRPALLLIPPGARGAGAAIIDA